MKYSYAEIRKICLKPDESEKPLYARWVTHTFSTRLIYFLQRLTLTPNQISTTALLFAILAIPFFIKMTPFSIFGGALLIEIYYILDAMDGQWARLKKMKSLTGAFLDYLSNYAIHPPLLFSLAWGGYIKTDQPKILLLGFLAAFSTLWINLLWNLRATILLEYFVSTGSIPQKAKYGKEIQEIPARDSSPFGLGMTMKLGIAILKMAFGWIHKSLVFPWFMNLLTITAVFSIIGNLLFSISAEKIFHFFLCYYGSVGPLMAVVLTLYWIWTRKLDHAPEIGNNPFGR